jgi:hypothetical protein
MKRVSLCLLLILVAATAMPAGQSAPTRSVANDFVFPGETATLPAPLSQAVAALSADELGRHVATLASPGFEGRGLGQRGLDATAEYILATLSRPGFAPRGTVSVQHVPVREITNASGQITVTSVRNGTTSVRTFASGVDGLFQTRPPSFFTAPVVFAGFGVREPALGRDDYRDLAVTDRIVVVLGALPAGPEWHTPAMRAKYAPAEHRHEVRAELAQSLGAKALVVIEDEAFPTLLTGGDEAPEARFFVPYDAGADNDGTIPVVRVSTAVGDTLLRPAGLSVGPAATSTGRMLPDTMVTIRHAGDEHLAVSRNVVLTVPGSDPALRDRAIVIGAHMDHLGRVESTVYPGADDNASGTAALLEIARVLASNPHGLKRTMVLVFWTGEEEGHLGSEYYMLHPVWPIERTSAYLNLDMIGHAWKLDEIRTLVADTKLERGDVFLAGLKAADFIELGVSATAPELDPVLKQAARAAGLALHLDRTDGRHGGSDYRAFARKGRPFVRFFGDFFDGYHEPTDTADGVAPGQVLKMTRVALTTAWLLADRQEGTW